MTENIRDLLQHWGYWHRHLQSPIPAYQSIAGIIHRMNTENPDRRPVCMIDDLTIRAIERAVAALKLRDRFRFDVIVMTYIHGMSDASIGAVKGPSRKTIEKERVAAEAWVDSRVFVEEAA